MEARGSGGGFEESNEMVVDPSDRGDFIRYVVDDFERNRMAVEQDVVDYMRNEMFVGEKEWEEGIRSGAIDVDQTQKILSEALEASGDLADKVGQSMVDMNLAGPAFSDVIQGRWKCPYPFMFC